MTGNKTDLFIALLRKQIKSYLVISVIIFLFILFFLPFPAEKFEFDNRLLFIAGFGFIVLFLLIIAQIIFQNSLFRNGFHPTEPTLMTYLYYVSLFIFTSLAFVFYIRYVGHERVTFNMVLRVIIIGISITFSLNLNGTLVNYNEKNKRLSHELSLLKDKIKHHTESYMNKYIELISENETDNFRIQVSNIIYFRSADNYVEVGFKDGSEIKKKLIRNTLKNIEQQLKDYHIFIRTHRTGIVNVQVIEKLNQSFSSYWLSLAGTSETIPVSRQYLLAVKDLL